MPRKGHLGEVLRGDDVVGVLHELVQILARPLSLDQHRHAGLVCSSGQHEGSLCQAPIEHGQTGTLQQLGTGRLRQLRLLKRLARRVYARARTACKLCKSQCEGTAVQLVHWPQSGVLQISVLPAYAAEAAVRGWLCMQVSVQPLLLQCTPACRADLACPQGCR